MNQNQIKYARQRVEEIFVSKKRAINDKYKQKDCTMSLQDKLEAIKNGEFEVGAYDKLEYLKFNAQKPDADLEEAKQKVLTALTKEKDQVLDELMLGDAEEALQALKQFDSFNI